MREYLWPLLYAAYYLIALLTIERMIRARREPRQTLLWILTLLFLPFFGLFFYLVIGPVPVQRRVRRRIKRRKAIAAALSFRSRELARTYGVETYAAEGKSKQETREIKDAATGTAPPTQPHFDAGQRALMRVASLVGDTVPTTGNDVHIFNSAEGVFIALRALIEQARHHIHLEYYIYADDETGRTLRDLLGKKAAEGVEVRVLLDAVGCWKLSRRFIRSMRELGIEVAFFLPWGLGRRIHLSCRNHRKLVVVDGLEGVVGSHNIADEYRGRKSRYGPWRDTTMKVHGPAVTQLQEVFVEDWHFATRRKLIGDEYFPRIESVPAEGANHVVQIVPSGPDRQAGIMDQLLFAAVADAHEEVLIVTPYFVPDAAMLVALQAAAYRGVRVRLLTPSRSDNWLVLWAGRSSYQDLLEAGIEVYEYDRGMLHSKVMVVDERWAMLGSANMDVRSFRINFEITSLLYDAPLAEFLREDFEQLLHDSHRVYLPDLKRWTYGQRLFVGLIRLAAPLL